MTKLLLGIFLLISSAYGQASGVGSIWTSVSGTLQSGATANGNGTAINVLGLSAAMLTVNCSVACSGGTTINFEASEDGTNFTAITGQQLGTSTLATTVLNQGTTPTIWELNAAGLQQLRARISGYSAGTITVTAHVIAAPFNPKVVNDNLFIGGTAVSTAASGIPKVGVVGNAGAAVDAATGAAPPANALLLGGLTSGATGGFVTAIPVCDTFYNINISTATTTLAITGVSGRHVRICQINMLAAAADNVGIISGTGATCGTGTAAIVGTTSATGYNLAANGGIAQGSGLGTIMRTTSLGDSVCIITSAATQLSGTIAYTIY